MRHLALPAVLLATLACVAPPAWSDDGPAPKGAGDDERPPREKPAGERPESEMWQRLKARDADGDGVIGRDEFPGGDRMWNRLDADGDGKVTRAEADRASEAMRGRGRGRGDGGMGRGRGGPGRGGPGRGGVERGRRGGLTPEALDTDKDGSVSKQEWDTFFEKADENGDRILQRGEWEAAVGGRAYDDRAPKVGAPAPKVSAQVRGGTTRVDLAAPKRTTVLVFGSWT